MACAWQGGEGDTPLGKMERGLLVTWLQVETII